MEDLDALLADLQHHIPKSDPPGARQNAVYANQETVLKQTEPEVIYQNETHYKQNGAVNGHASDKDMYKHEMREEIRTETHSSGPDIASPRPAVSSNLSELDSLLQDLNNAKKTGVFKDSNATTGARPSVDALLNELNKVENSTTSYNHTSNSRVKTAAPILKNTSASNATRELDDLMANLSDFKREDILRETNKEKLKKSLANKSNRTSWTEHYYGTCPPRPPPPTVTDVLVVPPPRPTPPLAIIPTDDTVLPVDPTVPTTIATAKVASTLRVTHRRTEVVLDDTNAPSVYGGPVKRNDIEYRWVTDQTKPEVRAVIDDPFEEPEIDKQPIQAIPFLQARVDTTYAKPQRPRTPTPEPPQNQLDSMLGSLTSHMTQQGIPTTPKGCCNACDKPIVGSVITALGKPWHPEHFVCAHCQQELGTKNFFERDGKPYCEPDYHDLFSPKCAYCSSAILDKCVTALNKTWHPEHFFCAQCGNTFGEDGFHEKNGKPYCRECYFNLFAPKCGGCNSPIMENYISALNAQWHPECFVCRDCRQPFNGGSFFDHEGLPYCETHYHQKRGSLCYGCHKPITGRCITAMFRKYHPEHFVCSFCLQQLNKGTFKEQNDKPYCHGCFDKLFG